MALDDFIDGIESPESETSSSSSTTSDDTSTQELLDREGITRYDDEGVGPRGPFGYQSRDEYEETIAGSLEMHGDLFKYKLPIFPHIEIEQKYERGKRYKGTRQSYASACAIEQKLPLAMINREVVMLDTGQTERDDCVEVLEERFEEEVGPETRVFLYFFVQTRHIVKMAIGDELTDSWSLHNKEALLKAVYGETWTQKFRGTDSDYYDFKHVNHIGEW